MESESPLDRVLQRELLFEMQRRYPERVTKFPGRDSLSAVEIANIIYLQEHGLCDAILRQVLGGHWGFGGAKITAKGLDFLAEDGGLTAILSVVTVKLHADTLREMLEAKIDASDATAPQKATLKDRVQKLSAKGLQAVSTELMKRGLDHVPDAIQWLHTFLPGL